VTTTFTRISEVCLSKTDLEPRDKYVVDTFLKKFNLQLKSVMLAKNECPALYVGNCACKHGKKFRYILYDDTGERAPFALELWEHQTCDKNGIKSMGPYTFLQHLYDVMCRGPITPDIADRNLNDGTEPGMAKSRKGYRDVSFLIAEIRKWFKAEEITEIKRCLDNYGRV
jgi:hypothetical protein